MEHSATVDGNASILVVCNPEDAAELAGILEGDPLPVVTLPGQVVASEGGDDTVARFVELAPDVVVVAATLDAGDARALIGAMRGAAAPGAFHVVLIGDARGPIRNALDAADFAADRFVARPIAPKALRFAVGSGAATARRARAAGATEASAAPEAVLPEPAVRVQGARRARMITAAPIGGVSPADLPTGAATPVDPARPASRTSAPPPPRARTKSGPPSPVLGENAFPPSGTFPGIGEDGRTPGTANGGRASSRLDAVLDAAVEDVARDEVVRRTSGGFDIPVEAILAAGGDLGDDEPAALPRRARTGTPDITAPMSVHEVPTRPVGALEQRMIASGGAAGGRSFAAVQPTPPAPITIQPRRTRATVEELPVQEAVVPDVPLPSALGDVPDLGPDETDFGDIGASLQSGVRARPPGLDDVPSSPPVFEAPTRQTAGEHAAAQQAATGPTAEMAAREHAAAQHAAGPTTEMRAAAGPTAEMGAAAVPTAEMDAAVPPTDAPPAVAPPADERPGDEPRVDHASADDAPAVASATPDHATTDEPDHATTDEPDHATAGGPDHGTSDEPDDATTDEAVPDFAIEAGASIGEESGSHELPPGLEAPILSETAGSFDERADSIIPPPPPDDWDAMPLPAREPTLIIREGAPAPVPAELDVTERRSDGGWATSGVAALADGGEDTTGDTRDDAGDFIGKNEKLATPPHGDFARELRRKMSMMAQRLFRQSEVPTPAPVDVRPPHDFRTEIDLAALDGGAGAAEQDDVYDLSGDATFAGDEHGLPSGTGAPSGEGTAIGHLSATGSARTSESGEIVRGTADAPVLIARMFVSEFTGKVVFRRPVAELGRGEDVVTEKVIFFDGGRPVFASSNLQADRMGELLYREGKITAEQYARCRDYVLESGRRMGEILVDRGFLKRRELLPAVRRHVEDIIYSLFAWDTGEYRIVSGDGAQSERIRLSRHPAAMVLEGVRRKLDQATLERLLGPTTTVVEVADRDKAGTVVAVADLSPDERAALAGMDGSADLGHIMRTTGAALVSVYQLAWAMTLLGVATVRRRGGEEDEAPALVGETDLVIDRERVRARHRLVTDADYFALLGVRRDATGFEIRRAYESSRRDFDAEAFPAELRTELAVELAEIESVLDEAYRVLRDDRLRRQYLAHLAE